MDSSLTNIRLSDSLKDSSLSSAESLRVPRHTHGSPASVRAFGEESSSRAFADALRDYCQRDLENCMIMWKRRRVGKAARGSREPEVVTVGGVAHSAEYLQFLQDEFPENINVNEHAGSSGTVVNVDARVCCERWEGAFARLTAEAELHKLGPPPEPPVSSSIPTSSSPPRTSPSLASSSPISSCSESENPRSRLLQLKAETGKISMEELVRLTAADARARELDNEIVQSRAAWTPPGLLSRVVATPFFRAQQRQRQASTVHADGAVISWAQPAQLPQSAPVEEREQNAILRVSSITTHIMEGYFFQLGPDCCGLDGSLSISISGHLAVC